MRIAGLDWIDMILLLQIAFKKFEFWVRSDY